MEIVLASSSPYRKALLNRILSDFNCASPNIDETPAPEEQPDEIASRLARQKALAIASDVPNALVIASDQVAWLDGEQLHKPGSRTANIEQLRRCQGKELTFYTSIALYNTKTEAMQCSVETYTTRFRELSEKQIASYVDREQAFDCAGGFKMEGLGIALFDRIQGDDPNILIGLPLIRLIAMLEKEGIDILDQ